LDPNITQSITFDKIISLATALINLIAVISVVYFGHRLTKNYESERNFRKAQRQAHYKYVETFSEIDRIKEWTPPLIHEKLLAMLEAALAVGELGDIGNNAVSLRIKYFLVENDPSLETDLRSRLRVYYFHCEINENGIINIKSFYGFIELIEALLRTDPSKIKTEELIQIGLDYIPLIRLQLLAQKAPWWKLFWWKLSRKKKDFTLFRQPLNERINAKSWWKLWKRD
jgi:hypothetical protein